MLLEFISIHAPRVGSDWLVDLLGCCTLHFNPRSPCGERRQGCPCPRKSNRFQSTLPVWGATPKTLFKLEAGLISIHAPRVGSDAGSNSDFTKSFTISIHAPRVGSDAVSGCFGQLLIISIHAPRVGSDKVTNRVTRIDSNFNPRSPCGERRQYLC